MSLRARPQAACRSCSPQARALVDPVAADDLPVEHAPPLRHQLPQARPVPGTRGDADAVVFAVAGIGQPGGRGVGAQELPQVFLGGGRQRHALGHGPASHAHVGLAPHLSAPLEDSVTKPRPQAAPACRNMRVFIVGAGICLCRTTGSPAFRRAASAPRSATEDCRVGLVHPGWRRGTAGPARSPSAQRPAPRRRVPGRCHRPRSSG